MFQKFALLLFEVSAVKHGCVQWFFICSISVTDTDSLFYAEQPPQILNESTRISVIGDLQQFVNKRSTKVYLHYVESHIVQVFVCKWLLAK